jgi:hypothetical protein
MGGSDEDHYSKWMNWLHKENNDFYYDETHPLAFETNP